MMHLQRASGLFFAPKYRIALNALLQARAENNDVVFAVSEGGEADGGGEVSGADEGVGEREGPSAIGKHNGTGFDFLQEETLINECR
jgi:hypothetical protein